MTKQQDGAYVQMHRQAVTMEGHVVQLLRDRRDYFNTLRERPTLSLPNTVELLLRLGIVTAVEVRDFKPTTRKVGRMRKSPGTPLDQRYS